MTDIPIIFSSPMIRALLDGRKTQTRRLAWRRDPHWGDTQPIVGHERDYMLPTPWQRVKPGDRLWVRESLLRSPEGHWRYAADGTIILMRRADPRVPAMAAWAHHKEGDHAPSIHMPRWASRLTLVVTATKIERLQSISEGDCKAEGIDYPATPAGEAFAHIWRALHGDESWGLDPQVVALTFVVHRHNIDAMPKEIAA